MCAFFVVGISRILLHSIEFMQICSLYDLKYTWHFIFLILNTIATSYLDLGMPWGSVRLRYQKIYPKYWPCRLCAPTALLAAALLVAALLQRLLCYLAGMEITNILAQATTW